MHPLDCDLSLRPPGRPTVEQRGAVAAAERRARALLALPRYELRWAHAPDSPAWGCTKYPASGPRVWIADHLPPDDCFKIALHELQHVNDSDIVLEISDAEAEARAEQFVARALRDTSGGTSAMVKMIATASGRCDSCRGPIAPGTPYLRDEEANRPTRFVHLVCGQASHRNGYATSRPAGPVRQCFCGGTILKETPATSTCWACKRMYFDGFGAG